MKPNLYINSFVKIEDQRIQTNGETLKFEANSIAEFCKLAYKSLAISYPKFYKMDKLSKLGFLACEFLMQDQDKAIDTSLIFANQSSSLDTDIVYQESIQQSENFLPSPSVFVYTLPNIVLGEISIRHQFTGENIFLVLDKFDPEKILEIVNLQHHLNKADNFIVTWIEVLESKIEVFSFYINEKENTNSLILKLENITNLINSK